MGHRARPARPRPGGPLSGPAPLPAEPAYVACYCEENIWRLVSQRFASGRPEAEVALLTHAGDGVCALFDQRAAPAPGQPIGWDYHVVLAARDRADGGWSVWDLDALGGLQQPAERWFDRCFPGVERWPAELVTSARLLEASEYLRTFSSDRSHMIDERGAYTKPPPPWPPIGAPRPSNLLSWLDLRRPDPGRVLGLTTLRERWSTRA